MYLEEKSRFSTSKLWQLQKSAYIQFGPQAWDSKKVPSYITTSPLIANYYAEIALGFIRDGLDSQAILPINPQEPLYIFDLGAGSGRFGYLFLKKLLSFLKQFNLPLSIKYVMTDIATGNLLYLQNHSHLQSFIDKGQLDFCIFQHDQSVLELHLIQSRKSLDTHSFNNPMILIANYFFDTLPHDLFRISHHRLEEGRVSLRYDPPSEKMEIIDRNDPAIIPFLKVETEYSPLNDFYPDYFTDPSLVEIVKKYIKDFETLPQLLIPIGAFHTLKYFSKLSQERYLLLAGDQGIHSPTQFKQEMKFYAEHDSFSIQVNYHAISHYFQSNAATCLVTTNKDPIMVNAAATSKGTPNKFPELSYAFQRTLNHFELNDYFRLMNNTIESKESINLEMIIKLIKMGYTDPCDFNLFFDKFLKELLQVSSQVQSEVYDLISSAWENFYPVSSQGGAFVMNLGVLCYQLKYYSSALFYFQEALKMGYEDPLVFQNIAAVRRILR